jgi:hypothetical protein
MSSRKVTSDEIKEGFAAGLTVTELAKKYNVTKACISKRSKGLGIVRIKTLKQAPVTYKEVRKKVNQDVMLLHAVEHTAKEIDAINQLSKINAYANEFLDLFMRWNDGDEEAIQILESQVSNKRIRVGKHIEFIKSIKSKDPRELAFIAMKEIREQLKLQFDMMRGLYDMEQIASFQEEILTAIEEIEPSVRKRIIENLQKKRVIHSVIRRN